MKTSWVKRSYDCEIKTCSSSKQVNKQINRIEMFMLRNIYPKFVNDSIISRLKEKKTSLPPDNHIDSTKFWMGLFYQGVKS